MVGGASVTTASLLLALQRPNRPFFLVLGLGDASASGGDLAEAGLEGAGQRETK